MSQGYFIYRRPFDDLHHLSTFFSTSVLRQNNYQPLIRFLPLGKTLMNILMFLKNQAKKYSLEPVLSALFFF